MDVRVINQKSVRFGEVGSEISRKAFDNCVMVIVVFPDRPGEPVVYTEAELEVLGNG